MSAPAFSVLTSLTSTRPAADPLLFRSELLTVRECRVVERCATRHQLAFARAVRHFGDDAATAVDPTRAVLVLSGDAPPRRAAIGALGTTWTVLGFAREAALLSRAPWPRGRVDVTVAPRVLMRLHALRAALLHGTPLGPRAVEDEALALLAELLASAAAERATHVPGSWRRRVLAEGARAIVARDPGAAHPLVDVARALGVSASHLAHVFRAEVGMPLHRWLLHIRLAVALERLAAGDAHLSALALDLGFATHSHFSAAFRRWLGTSPAAARAALRGTHIC